MGFKKKELRDTYLLTTEVENLYINESMIDAPGNYVKVYLYGLYLSNYGSDLSISSISKTLRLDIMEVDNAFSYWEKLGLIKKEGSLANYNYDIIYISQRELLYSSMPEEKKETPKEFVDLSLKKIYETAEQVLSRTLSDKEMESILSWKTSLKASNDVITEAITYCASRGKDNINYIQKVIISWVELGLVTKSDVENHLNEIDERQDSYKRILKSLGLNRNATEAEKTLIDTWFDELKFNIDKILEACSRTISTTNPNLKYVNKILENWANEAKAFGRDVNNTLSITVKDVKEYLSYLREKEELDRDKKLEDIYIKIPRIKEIDEELKKVQGSFGRSILKGLDVSGIKNKIKELESEKAALLTENNFEMDYLDIKYRCNICKDTGVDPEGNRCKCFNERFNEAEIWQKTK